MFHFFCGLCAAALAASTGGCSPETPTAAVDVKPAGPSAVAEAERGAKPAAGKKGSKASEPGEPTTLRFSVMNDESGVQFTYRNDMEKRKRCIIESVGGGAGMVDFDRDGRLDLVFAGGGYYGKGRLHGHPGAIFRNLGEWKFENVTGPAAGGLPSEHFSHGVHAADYDNDGFLDLVICGYGGLALWHNLGDGTFQEVHAAAKLDDTMWSTCAGWGDLNGDGALDLYVGHYGNWSLTNDPLCPAPVPNDRESCPPRTFQSLPDTLYFSNGDGTFRDVSREAGLNLDPKKPDGTPQELGKALGILIVDVDLDGDQDIYVANDTVDNFLYLNDGTGKFVEDGVLRGVGTDDNGMANGSMGVDVGDYNRDGRPDLWVTNYEHEAFGLYRNDGELFTHVSNPLGITALGGVFVGFGTVFADLDRDGFEDIVVNNGHVQFFPQACPIDQDPVILMNQKGQRFRRLKLPNDPFFGGAYCGRGLAGGDLDDDGDLDFCFVSNNNQPSYLLRNDSTDDGRWLRMRLIGSKSNRDGIGAKVTLHTDSGDLVRFVKGAVSFASHCDLRPIWGFPKEALLQEVTIQWPSGVQQKIGVSAQTEPTILESPP
jgi:hypothetical protein